MPAAEDREFHGLSDDLPVDAVENPQDQDVLCGRGGAALRHPGNQTYRRLVHLNKALYITCLKQEKLKISRSIVAAIREQNGRFLERDTHAQTWYDIGDKKAMEKTSQALREGQPKLRRKIEEAGGGAIGAQALLQNQFPNGNIYGGNPNHNSARHNHQQQQTNQHMHQQQQQQLQRNLQPMQHDPMQQYNTAMASGAGDNLMGSMEQMPPPVAVRAELHHPTNVFEQTIEEEPQGSQQRFSLSHPRGSAVAQELGIDQSTLSLMSDFSNYGAAESQLSFQHQGMNGGIPGPPQASPVPSHLPSISAPIESPSMSVTSQSSHIKRIDRRQHFARMKYSRPPSGRFKTGGSNRNLYASNRSIKSANSGDGMPDIHLVESNPSLFSGNGGRMAADGQAAAAGPPNVANIFESRRSLMSGLSRISDASDMNSIFSDLSRKIGNVSTRSIAMSEISNMDDHCNLEEFDVDPESLPGTASMDEFDMPSRNHHHCV